MTNDIKVEHSENKNDGSPSPSFALLIGDWDVITFIENIQQGPEEEKHTWWHGAEQYPFKKRV